MLDIKEILEQHPLYRRLSGQVIWLMFEERGAAENHIQAFLDRYETEKRKNLELMRAALEGQGFSHLLMIQGREDLICERCRKVSGRVVETDRPDLAAWFPPYGLGCALSPRLLTIDEYAGLGRPEPLGPELRPPGPRLLCGEWIFEHPWADLP